MKMQYIIIIFKLVWQFSIRTIIREIKECVKHQQPAVF